MEAPLYCALDIDGTLVRLEPAEELIFGRACAEVLGRVVPRLSWSDFEVVTDTGIIDTIWRTVAGRPPRADEVEAVRDRHCAGLAELVAGRHDAFAPIPGVEAFLSEVAGWSGLATGNSAPAARLKLAAAGLDGLVAGLPLASAEDGPEREAILRTCARALALPVGARLVSVGDGTWDVAAARVLGLPFVGIAPDPRRAERLRAAGAGVVLADLRDLEEVLRALRTAPVPGRPG